MAVIEERLFNCHSLKVWQKLTRFNGKIVCSYQFCTKDAIAIGYIRYTVLHLHNLIQFMDHIFQQGGSDNHIKHEMFIVNYVQTYKGSCLLWNILVKLRHECHISLISQESIETNCWIIFRVNDINLCKV